MRMKESDSNRINSDNPEHLDNNELAQFAEFLRHETDRIPDRLADHVASCAFCREELMAITDILDRLPDEPGETAQPVSGVRSAAYRNRGITVMRILRTAAAVAAVVLIAWGIKRLMPDRSAPAPMAANRAVDSTLQKGSAGSGSEIRERASDKSAHEPAILPDTVRLAAAFLPNPVYENLAGAKFRSGSDPLVRGPEQGRVLAPGDTLEISWTPGSEKEFALVIMDNRAKEVKKLKQATGASIRWKTDLEPGLYYWKFMGGDEMWKVGKFKIIIR
jgi:hypothetical protein